MNIKNNWYIIINPNAGKKKGRKDWNKIAFLLDKAAIKYEPVFTTHMHHAIELTRNAIVFGWRNFIVVGGDGTSDILSILQVWALMLSLYKYPTARNRKGKAE